MSWNSALLIRPGVGVTKAPFINFSVMRHLDLFKKYRLDTFGLAAVTPVRYERAIIQDTVVSIIVKNWENNGTEKIGLITPTPDQISNLDPETMWL